MSDLRKPIRDSDQDWRVGDTGHAEDAPVALGFFRIA
jgi:hypothetical protein